MILLLHYWRIGWRFTAAHSWVITKKRLKIAAPQLYLHVLVHGLLVFALTNSWKITLILLSIHYLIDLAKLYFQQEKRNGIGSFSQFYYQSTSTLDIFEKPDLQQPH